MPRPIFQYIHESHLDLFWIGDYRYCLERGGHVIKDYIDRCLEYTDETFMLETVVFLEYFLEKHPEYLEAVKKLWKEGRLDIGAAYVDILEHHVFGEGQIRNIARGKKWCRDNLGIDTKVASHTDLPSLISQIAQIYSKAGVHYYSTSRKIFPNGAVWIHEAPDGTAMMIFNHPCHYDFHELKRNASAFNEGRGWFEYIDPQEIVKGFPLGKLILSAGASDQTDLKCFRDRYGKSAREFVEEYRALFPEIDFSFGSITAMMEEYSAIREQLPKLQGEIPSVWGISSVEPDFFSRACRLEGLILAVEQLEAIEKWLGMDTIAGVRGEWNGTLYERLFFLDKDPVACGKELEELWKMHLFVLDHNFGGNYAAQTRFDKRTIQERALSYAGEMVSHGLGKLSGGAGGRESIMVFNPLNWVRREPVTVDVPLGTTGSELDITDHEGNEIPWQCIGSSNKKDWERIVFIPEVQGVGYRLYGLKPGAVKRRPVYANVIDNGYEIVIDADFIRLEIDKKMGCITQMRDKRRNADWGGSCVNKLYAASETGFDVPLTVDESKPLAVEEVLKAELEAVGPVFISVRISKRILNADVTQRITIWLQGLEIIDMKTSIYWHGQRRVQMRQHLPSACCRDDIYYGTPFCGSNWNNVVPGSGPKNPDEMKRQDWLEYREAQLWLHQRKDNGALAVTTDHSTYHWGSRGLEAVFFRTTPSCSDDRYFKECSGLLEYGFRYKFTDTDAGIAVPSRLGQQLLMPLAVQHVKGSGVDSLTPGTCFIDLGNENLILSAVYPGEKGNEMYIRFFEAGGSHEKVRLRIPGATKLERVSLLGEVTEEISRAADRWPVEVKPYEIVTIKAVRN